MDLKIDFTNFFQGDRFRCFDIDDISALNKESLQLILQSMDDILNELFKSIGYKHYVQPNDAALRDDLRQWATKGILNVIDHGARKSFETIINEAATVAEYFYPLSSHQTRLCLAKGTAAVITVDDNFLTPSSHRKWPHFQSYLYNGQHQQDQQDDWWAMYSDMMKDFVDYFGSKEPYMGIMGAAAWANFVSFSSLEFRLTKEKFAHLKFKLEGDKFNGCCPNNFPNFFCSHSGGPRTIYCGYFQTITRHRSAFERVVSRYSKSHNLHQLSK
jgi:hypothetical protein